ncbi:MAG: cysteine--tRNA ligase [Zetaproteobacteria bacterium CG_4_9_14_3_um_filter_49_83]|nr:MAG: cysteine--tRNA ligase [Zetaproteobacteria bacterium CG1_02_49_23]PIQ32743.1 MAG: cysteine--tRNA ligase [Zetaproteobacteria bacterium CG17_big_fil_post_rev_8_21_14_2_50_50_13]PIV29608.1 MAG: cysteine--tRNA ligase [Zetaproteobacteria bacterium CG02_land_8_20_14_3_00_50_9]PIY54944.1 MAG: cysteine--tRNA ligase [Zetaproteobacteria bacterium CG_4_10_14_0_8_um_filter_49_80]PJA35311.1 MAG: cysteine--tRNA ligase [Zetaproteobacteria bacterium CG_4_9_14_3_um_filter_49_83]
MSLVVYNSLSRQKEPFVPLQAGHVGMYVCGVTVYDLCHVGHARSTIVFDIVYRWLQQSGYVVNYVRNFTDVDDKIIRRANESGISTSQLTESMIQAFHEDMDALACLRPLHEPRATLHMQGMITMIGQLVDKGMAYVSRTGDVLYSVRKFEGYGQLSGKRIEELESGSRIEVDESKEDPLDFVLWKMAKPGEPAWDSPWGQGRPGWHIECSAMSCSHLGETFDIHGGGMDLKFPHHENEIAQARAANGGGFARYWLHNGFVNINEEKMSKSLGNFFTIREVLKSCHPEVLRMFVLSTHYRSPLDFSDQALDVARVGLDRLYEIKQRIDAVEHVDVELPLAFVKAMNDDFNTPEALAAVYELGRNINKAMDAACPVDDMVAAFRAMCSLLGILQSSADAWFRPVDLDAARIEGLIVERNAARKSRDFARADEVRDLLAAEGIILEDGANGTTWKKE